MSGENYFSWDNVGEMTDVESHISYASSLLDKYQWKPDTKSLLEQQFRRIIAKQNDHLLNISVIGEFSTGKSSFINALVGYELLAVNAIQGTTVAITVIEYAEQFCITITDFDGGTKAKRYNCIEDLSKELYSYTTDPKYAGSISFLTVSLPSDILKTGFRIIDTPGTNSLDLWHEEVTMRAIEELSDLSIIMVDATTPMPESLISFTKGIFSKGVYNCAFLVNKIDLIREKERSKIVEYVGVKIRQELQEETPFVLPFSSVALTNMFSDDKYPVDNDSFLITTDSLGKLQSYTAKNRIKAQVRKLLQLIDQMYVTLNNDMHIIADKYEQELHLLKRSEQADLSPFIQSQISLRQKTFLDEARNKKFIVEHNSDNLIREAINSINKSIDSHQTIDNLSNYIKSGCLSDEIKKAGIGITDSLENSFGDIESLFRCEIRKFQQDFQAEFSRLQLLSMRIEAAPRKVNIRRTSNTANIGPVTTLITEELSNENWAMGGGAATGATVGTMLAPGIGTVVGAFIGLFAGGFVAPNVEDVRKKVKTKLSTPLNSYFRSVSSDCISNYNTYINDLNRNIQAEITRYYTEYNSVIKGRIAEWERQHNSVYAKIRKIQSEIDSIQSRRCSIHNIISKF